MRRAGWLPAGEFELGLPHGSGLKEQGRMGTRLSDGRSSMHKYIKAAKSPQFSGKEQGSCLIPKKSLAVWKHLL